MNTKVIAALIILVLAGYGAFVMFRTTPEISVSPIPTPPPTPVACTMEAKLCPDGSSVGRTGLNCEFAKCPNETPTTNKSGVSGTVTLSPTCPVERVPPDPNCAPKSYSTSIDIYKSGSTKILKTIKSGADGAFSAELDPGTYVLKAKGGNTLPSCPEVSVVVKSNQYTNTEISCDTGIR